MHRKQVRTSGNPIQCDAEPDPGTDPDPGAEHPHDGSTVSAPSNQWM
jgi:hypothetical protein